MTSFDESLPGKRRLRDEMRVRRRALSREELARASAAVCRKLAADGDLVVRADPRGGGSPVAVYLAAPRELDLSAFIREMLRAGAKVVAPRWNGSGYDLAVVKGLDEANLRKGPMGILEPAAADLVDPGDVGAWVVPGLAFSRDGARLGYGGGWYDRLLAGAAPRALKLGVAHSFQLVDAVPSEPHDVRLSRIVDDSVDAAIRILALDLDGTLLDSEKRLSEANRAALAEAAANGVLVVPTTGRFFGMMPECVRDLPFIRYAITINGAQVYDRQADSSLLREEMPLDTALAVMRVLDGRDVIYDCYRNSWGWITESFKSRAADYATNVHYLKMVREFRHGVPELKAHLEATRSEGDVQKIMLFTRLDAGEGASAELAADLGARFPEVNVTSSAWNNLELNSRAAHKGAALRRLAEHFGWTLDNCMAFGDGMNDLSMIEAAGVGVAMANACPQVLAAADRVTLSNDDDGVAAALRAAGIVG